MIEGTQIDLEPVIRRCRIEKHENRLARDAMSLVPRFIRERRMTPLALLIGFVSAVALLGSLFKYHETSEALIDSYPEEFREGTLWRTAFPIFALSPLTPLDLQLGFLQSLTGSCCATLGISLSCFLSGKVVAGWIILTMFVGFTFFLIGYWRTYLANRKRKTALSRKDET